MVYIVHYVTYPETCRKRQFLHSTFCSPLRVFWTHDSINSDQRHTRNMSAPLQNYLKTYRKRGGLTQDEMAYLLGCQDGAKVSRYERLHRQPNLETALGCQVVFGVPAHELFPGMYKQVEQNIIPRAQLLSKQVTHGTPDPYTNRKIEALNSITGTKAGELAYAL